MEWIKVFNSSDDARSRLKENIPQLLILHNVRISLILRQGNFFAVEDFCPHNGESLSKGGVNFSGEIVCPLHGYRFALKSGRESSERCRDLKTYLTREDETGFYVGI